MPKNRAAFVSATLFLFTVAPCSAQNMKTVKPSGKDPVAVACPGTPQAGKSIDAYEAWKKGDEILHSEGGGAFMLNFGTSQEAVQWFCRASAAGSSIAPYTIGEIFGRGFMGHVGPGKGANENHLRDPATSFYWYKLSADRGFTRGMFATAWWYGAGVPGPKGLLVPPNKTEALGLLEKAAAAGDTEAQLVLYQLYSGLDANPWRTFVSVPRDNEKAKNIADNARAILDQNTSVCASHKLEMIAQLPDPRRGVTGKVSVVHVHGTSEPLQVICQIQLAKLKESDEDEQRGRNVLGVMAQGTNGMNLDYWQYTITKMPGGQSTVTRQIVAEAMGTNAEQRAIELEKYMPAPRQQ